MMDQRRRLKGLLLTKLCAALLVLFNSPSAFAVTALKQVQVGNGSEVDLLFDGKVSKSQIKTEFFNDIIQISLNDVSVYPAKISSVNGSNFTKIFAYQYAPKLVRCRLSVRGKAENYRNRISIEASGPNGRMLTVRVAGTTTSAENNAGAPVAVDSEEKALLEKVIKSTPAQQAQVATPEKALVSDKIIEKAAAPATGVNLASSQNSGSEQGNSESKPLNFSHQERGQEHGLTGSHHSIPSPMGVFGKLALVVGIFSLMALGVKKFWKGGESQNQALMGAIGKLARTSMGGKAKMIEVLANHHLGPKRSIAVVRIGGRVLAVGITEQNINLISELSGEEDAMNALVELDNPPLDDKSTGPAVFSDLLQGEKNKPATQPFSAGPLAQTKLSNATGIKNEIKKDVRVTAYGSTTQMNVTGNLSSGTLTSSNVSAQAAVGLSSVRAQIKSKLDGLKQI